MRNTGAALLLMLWLLVVGFIAGFVGVTLFMGRC